MYLKSKYTSKIVLLLLIGTVLGICVLMMRLQEMVSLPTLDGFALDNPDNRAIIRVSDDIDEDICGLKDVVCSNEKVKITAFSSVECHTIWCRNNPERIGHQIALNYSVFGRAKQVYIPAYQKTYEVIGTTDQNTMADIYMGSDYESAKQFGVQYLEIKIIKK